MHDGLFGVSIAGEGTRARLEGCDITRIASYGIRVEGGAHAAVSSTMCVPGGRWRGPPSHKLSLSRIVST